MAKYLFTTMIINSTIYTTPRGQNYSICKNQPFDVQNAKDIEFFDKNHRFQKLGIIGQVKHAFKKPEPIPDLPDLWAEKIGKVSGLSKSTIKKILKVYTHEKLFIDYLSAGDALEDLSIPKKQEEILMDLYKNLAGDE